MFNKNYNQTTFKTNKFKKHWKYLSCKVRIYFFL